MVGNDRESFLVRSGIVMSIVLGIGVANVDSCVPGTGAGYPEMRRS
jgi:hypothetical protein